MSRNPASSTSATSPVEELQLRSTTVSFSTPNQTSTDRHVNNLVQELDQPQSAENAATQRLSLERLLRPERFVWNRYKGSSAATWDFRSNQETTCSTWPTMPLVICGADTITSPSLGMLSTVQA